MIKIKEYWSSEVEEAFAEYITSNDAVRKNEIFEKHLYSAFVTLIDKTVKRYRPETVSRYTDEVRLDILSYLVVMCQKFNPEAVSLSGKKANGRSYCVIIVRSFIANTTVKDARKKKTIINFDDWHKTHQEI